MIIFEHSYMKKKSQRCSYKKLTQTRRRQELKVPNESMLYDRKIQIKANSSQKSQFCPEMGQKFKINSKNNIGHIRLKTEVEQIVNRSKYNYNGVRVSDKADKANKFIYSVNDNKKNQKYTYRNIAHVDPKKQTSKKLHLNHQLFKIIKQGSYQKQYGSSTAKNIYQSFRKPHESHRSAVKRTVLQDYVSGSLQNLKRKKSQTSSREGHRKLELAKQPKNQQVSKQEKTKKMALAEQITSTQQLKKKIHTNNNEIDIQQIDDETYNDEYMKQKNMKRENRFERKQIHRKVYAEKDESLEKFQIKFQKANKYDLSREQMEMFGDRFPDGFEKLKLLGRGGFSLVWLGQHKKSKKRYAVKQIITQSSHQTHIKQIWFGTYFFEFGGAPKTQFINHSGINNLVKLYYYFINKKDTWILYEKCGDSLGNCLYQLKGERINNQKMYRIYYKSFYERIRKNQNQLRKILLEVAKALELLAENNIVHSDLKTQNILIRQKTQQQVFLHKNDESCIAQIKLIDYGSSFVFSNLRQFSMATPQYMAPEVLNFILYENEMEYIHKLLDYTQKYDKPWVIDMWSLGCVLLEIVSGIPLWMSLKTLATKYEDKTEHIKYGLFAVKGRLFDKIIRRQIEVIQNLDQCLEQENYSGIKLEPDLKALLKRMLALNPNKRISPSEVIQFLEESLLENGSVEIENSQKKTQKTGIVNNK